MSASFAVDKTTFDINENIKLRCAIRNNTDETITIQRPFGDTFYTLAYGLMIMGSDGPVPYRGGMKSYVLGTSAFIQLSPGMVEEGTIELPPDTFPGLGVEGLYVISNEFVSNAYPKQPAPDNFWKGKIKTRPVIVLVSK